MNNNGCAPDDDCASGFPSDVGDANGCPPDESHANGCPSDAGDPNGYRPDLGDLIVVLLASSLAGLRDRLYFDGFEPAADLISDLVEAADDYLMGRSH